MDIKEFFDRSAGTWLSQRTHYHLAHQEIGDGKSEIAIELLAADAAEVDNLCKSLGIETTSAWSGVKVRWDNSSDWGKDKQIGSSLLVAIPDADNAQTGKLVQKVNTPQAQPMTGQYSFDEDQALTLIAENGTTRTEERIWFANENLRLRTSLVKKGDRVSRAAFYSEIRRMSS
jgi:phycoerythrin-associated linker protein